MPVLKQCRDFTQLLCACAFLREWTDCWDGEFPYTDLLSQFKVLESRSICKCARVSVAAPCNSGSGGSAEVYSIAVHERHQHRVSSLPCGARSLLLKPRSAEENSIVFRGINKFPSITETGMAWLSDATIPTCVDRIILQRKMAGFLVHVFSLDGICLVVMSKHSLDGPHVELARSILSRTYPTLDQRALAAELFQLGAAIAFECIAAEDRFHPTPDREPFQDTLTAFSLHCMKTRAELAFPFCELVQICHKYGLHVVPHKYLSKESLGEEVMKLVTATADWAHSPFSFGMGEGYVLCLEVPPSNVLRVLSVGDSAANQLYKAPICFPLRLKMKTARYDAIRAARSMILEQGCVAANCRAFFSQVFFAWGISVYKSTQAFVSAVENEGIASLVAKFESRVDELPVEQRTSFWQAAASTGRHVVVILCGMPGSGKTTLCAEVTRLLAASADSSVPFDGFVVSVSRDLIARDVHDSNGAAATRSAHSERLMKKEIHHRFVSELSAVAAFAAAPVITFVDACNAEPNGRALWRNSFSSSSICIFCNVRCDNREVLARRAAIREDHPTLKKDDAERALYQIGSKLVYATPSELASLRDSVVDINTEVQDLPQCAQTLFHAVCGAVASLDQPTRGFRVRSVTTPELLQFHQRAVGDWCAALGVPPVPNELPAAQQTPQSPRTPHVIAVLPTDPTNPNACSFAESWTAVLQSTVAALASQAGNETGKTCLQSPLPVAESKPTRPGFWGWVANTLRGVIAKSATTPPTSSNPAFSLRLIQGHAQWMRGLFLGRSLEGTFAASAAIVGRYNIPSTSDAAVEGSPLPLHCTLQYLASGTAETQRQEVLHECLRRLRGDAPANSALQMEISQVLIDSQAVCWGVHLCSGGTARCAEPPGGLLLHVTLGHLSDVPPKYCWEIRTHYSINGKSKIKNALK